MPFFKIRSKLKELLSPEMASNGQFALEHVLDAIGKFDPSLVTATYLDGDRSKVVINADIAELITLWQYGYELKTQDMRVHALICKLLKLKV
ncbi:MAG: hypothetical protein Tp172MES00d2C118482111_36 [Prokaryotic dsDNA virus sp.]|nr:MAG: hypothetical protein Tp172MES00d2C118482111_36 [Prokaryotic dsDNA virus sp.]|tara:strand:+ start:3621 stop:3896 length:276 start_codon:yes stop_codon:yes gene_type:complete